MQGHAEYIDVVIPSQSADEAKVIAFNHWASQNPDLAPFQVRLKAYVCAHNSTVHGDQFRVHGLIYSTGAPGHWSNEYGKDYVPPDDGDSATGDSGKLNAGV